MFMKHWRSTLAGAAAGAINGLLGAGGGMVLVPLLQRTGEFEEQEVFPASVAIILPLCLVSLGIGSMHRAIPFGEALPYLLGSIPGGVLAGLWGKKIPVKWLHRALGLIILWGGVRNLC